jgi:hypothetical protein
MQEEGSGKSPDPADLFIGIMEFIKKLFLRKRLFLSDKAYNSLFISMLLVFQIWLTQNYPAEAYIAAVVAFGYFLLHLINKLLLERSDRDIIGLRDNVIAYNEIASKIKKCAISKPHEIIEIIKEYIKNKRFSEDIQIALFAKYGRYSFELREYIENEIIIKQTITPKALGVFLITSVLALPDEFLEKIVDKYRNSNSFLFNLGRSQMYKFEDGTKEQKYYNAGYQFKKFRKLTRNVGIFVIISLAIAFFALGVFYGIIKSSTPFGILIFYSVAIFYFIVVLLIVKIRYLLDKEKARTLLMNEQIELSEIDFDKFINELNLI